MPPDRAASVISLGYGLTIIDVFRRRWKALSIDDKLTCSTARKLRLFDKAPILVPIFEAVRGADSDQDDEINQFLFGHP